MKPPFEQLGLPTGDTLRGYRIWDSYFTPSHSHPGKDGSSRLLADVERSLPAISNGQIEKLCYFPHVGTGTTVDSDVEELLRSNPDTVRQPLQQYPKLLIGMIQLNANDLPASQDAIDRWLRDGPMVGVYFPGSGPGACICTHRNFDPLVERIADLNGVIVQHTWFKSGGRTGVVESTPTDLARLAERHPDQMFVCAHAGGEWEKGIRAVHDSPNVLIETSGFDATAGFIEMAVRELGSDRIIFGTHLPSRSLGTELAKVIAANITENDKRDILGANFRRLLSQN